MHSILESDGVSSDPFEVTCHMGILIIEGRTPKTVGETITPSETGAKSGKPYTEGPHCPNFMKLYNKDSHNVHKCTENNILCIRYNNLKQHLHNLQQKTSTISIEVSLGPDCLCGELRSSSTLVSTPPCKRDIVLEQWTITIGQKKMQEPSSQMSVMNLYQAVRSLLHFSQLTAWYMCNKGIKPAHVIYRVGIPEDSACVSEENFTNHDFPVASINKTFWMKISVKTLPRMEKIPKVYCPQHFNTAVEGSQSSHFEPKESQKANKESFLSSEPLHSKFSSENKEELLGSKLPLKFQGARKKTYEAQERKRKKHITLFNGQSPEETESCLDVEFLDGMPIDMKKFSKEEDSELFFGTKKFQGEPLKLFLGESSKAESKKSKSAFPTDLAEMVKRRPDFDFFETFSCNFFEEKAVPPKVDLLMAFKNRSDSISDSDFRTKWLSKANSDSVEAASSSVSKKLDSKTVMDILDDRMQISCAISGKHHCKWECEEENDLNNPGGNVEKPKRRRSLSRVKVYDCCEDVKLGGSDSEKILHGKFKEVDSCKSDLNLPLMECEDAVVLEESQAKCFPEQSHSPKFIESSPKLSTCSEVNKSSVEFASQSKTPKIKSLPFKATIENEQTKGLVKYTDIARKKSSQEDTSPENKTQLNWIKTESFESFRRGCTFSKDSATESSSDSEVESSDSQESSNPFLAAILRSTKKSKTLKKCDSSFNKKLNGTRIEGSNGKSGGLFLEKFKDPIKNYVNEKISDLKAKVDVSEKVQCKSPAGGGPVCCDVFKATEKNLDLRLNTKFPTVSNRKDFNEVEDSDSSEFFSKNLNKIKSRFFDGKESKPQVPESLEECEFSKETGSSNSNFTKTIPVPSAHDKLKFRRSLDSAAQLVFHRCSGLPLTSSPAPVRRNNNSFSFDSSLNSVSAIKSALFEPSNSLSSEDENESEGSLKSPASPGAWSVGSKQINYHSLSPLPLLGSFEESVLNGRLEPVSTVQGFTAELGASGSFCPRHLYLPVTVFFYTLGDNDKVSAPYLGHINLGKKGYNVPRSGTIQVTLFNPLRTVVKMFVVVYDLHDMPPNSHTFLRQRTLYVPASQKESTYTDKNETPFDQEDYHKYLRYLIHLRFVSGKSGKIYLHTDIRMVIFRKADEDTATALGNQTDGEAYELRSHTHGPINPKFSPRR